MSGVHESVLVAREGHSVALLVLCATSNAVGPRTVEIRNTGGDGVSGRLKEQDIDDDPR
jgi:hypothetical protein